MRRENLILISIVVVTLILLVGAAFLFSNPQSTESTDAVTDTALLQGTKDHKIGSDSAKVTVVEFADFQCPACGAAYPIVKQVSEEYKDRVQFIYRHFPLPGHRYAMDAAKAAEAAGKQNKYFEMADLLYTNQAEWSEANNAKEIFEDYAESLQLDMAQFRTDRDANTATSYIQKDQNDGLALGVNSTPTFYIDGEKYTGVIAYDRFKELLDSKLK